MRAVDVPTLPAPIIEIKLSPHSLTLLYLKRKHIKVVEGVSQIRNYIF